ncbi:MAG: CsgG/HfaB family protein [Treponema sp.]|jgi:TolB-like protein|nr:CsgG/HfaB family protein [Treponema sp.]
MEKKMVVFVGLMFFVFSMFSSCVSRPRYSDYMGLPKEAAMDEIHSDKTKNTVKLVCNWVLWGWTTAWISSVVDTFVYIGSVGEFKKIETRILSTEASQSASPVAPANQVAPASPVNQVSRTQGATGGIEGAVNRACETLIYELPKKATVAVLSVSSRDRNAASFVMDEIEFQLVDSKEFQMVDRKTLDSVRSEQDFQMSGDVSDASAVSIGSMLGANVVITGTISGSGDTQRLIIKALDVKTAKILTMAREQF